MTGSRVAINLGQVRARIRAAAHRAGRAPDDVALVAVSKRQPSEAIRAAYQAGQRVFGESYVQEALAKMALLADLDIEWHFVGRVQSNKTRSIAVHFDWVHGLADATHARRLSEQRPTERPPLNVCVQINLSGESSKAGLDPAQVSDLLAVCDDLSGIRVRGLMTLPSPAEGEMAQRRPFQVLRALRDGLANPTRPLTCLSMGMTSDLEAAVLEGATFVRIGTAIFGPRPYN